MCELCNKVKNNTEYSSLLAQMEDRDIQRLEYTKRCASEFSSISIFAYSTIKYPKLLIYPLFEPKIAFATPINYFQNLFINDERVAGNFSHGSTRSLFFIGKKLMLFSKSTATHEGKEFFSSFLFAHFEPSEYSFGISPENKITISADCEKTAKNLLTDKVEKVHITFSFAQENLEGKLMNKNNALASTLFVNQFKRSGVDARLWLNSTEYMFEYVVSVAHFSPHPYMLRFLSQFGYSSQSDFQMHTLDYFKAHLTHE